jgi:hypothetical protein
MWWALYAGLGGVVLMSHMGLWTEGLLELEITPAAEVPLAEALFLGLLSLFVLTVGISVLSSMLIAKNKKFFHVAVANASLTLTVYFFFVVASHCYRNSIEVAVVSSFWSLFFGIINGGIVGCSTYLHLVLHKRSRRKSFGIEALKLEHNWALTSFTTLSYASIIFVVSAVLVSWTQLILPSIPIEKYQSVGLMKLYFSAAVQLVYIAVGLWFGLVGKLQGYSLQIHKNMLKLEAKEQKQETKQS